MNDEDPASYWLARSNSRAIGTVEFRRVTMEIHGLFGRRTLRVMTIRHADDGVARSLFCIAEPRPFRNINYTSVEHRGRIDPFPIQLYLPYMGGTLRDVAPNKRFEGYFGSDFSYDDLRIWLYQEDHEYGMLEEGEETVALRGVYRGMRDMGNRAGTFDLLIDRESGLVAGIEYCGEEGGRAPRRFSVDETTAIDGVHLPKRMSMRNLSNNHHTVITLEDAWYDRPIDPAIFDPAFRPYSYDYLSRL